jgi:hypothetical protein
MSSGRGGSRPGAGRPVSCPSKLIRISSDLNRNQIEEILALIEDYQIQSDDSSSTSPRWEKMREFLNEVRLIKF